MAPGAKKMISMKNLPQGYRLKPTDEEFVNHHLRRKLLNIKEQYCLIPEFDIYKFPPWDLITKFNELSDLASDGGECFFYYRRSNPKSKQSNRRTKEPEGFWKCTGKGRQPQETDRIKWSKKYLVFKLGKQKTGIDTEWAMHEYTIISDQSIVLCCIHKKGNKKVGSVLSEADSNSSPRTTDCSETTQEISPEASASATMDPQNLPLTSNINVLEYSMSSPQQNQITAEGRWPPTQDTYNNALHLEDLLDPQDPQILMREQSPCSENAFLDGCEEEYVNWLYPQDVTPEETGNEVICPQASPDQSSTDVLLGFGSPPQQPQMMPTEEIYPPIVNTSFNDRDSCKTYHQLDACGQGAQVPVLSMNHGPLVTNFKEAPYSTSPMQTQTTISPPTFDLLSPEQLQMLQELLSAHNMQPSSDCSEGGSPYALNFGQSPQPNLEMTRDFATESPSATQDWDIDSLLDSFYDAAPPAEVVMGENSLRKDGTVTGVYSTDYCGVPYASGGTCKMKTSTQ